MTRPVDLPPDLEAFIDARIAAGEYASADEAIRAAIDLLRQRDQARAKLNALIDEGYESLERGERTYTVEEAMFRIRLWIAGDRRGAEA